MKNFQFLAKQGQHNEIARLLTANFGKPRVAPYKGRRGEGVMITLAVREGVSKRSIDRLLHQNGVSGAVNKKNKPVFKADSCGYVAHYKIEEKIGVGVPFRFVLNGKFHNATLKYVDFGCTCCGGYYEVVDRKGQKIK